MVNMMEMVREDILTTYFGSPWSGATIKIADTSTEKACQSKWWLKRMETKRKSFSKVLDSINRMNNKKAENSPSGKNTKPREP